MLDAPVEYFIDTGKEPVAVVIYRRGGFFLCRDKITWSPHKASRHSYGPPTLAVSRQSVFHSPPSSSMGDDWSPMSTKSWTRKHRLKTENHTHDDFWWLLTRLVGYNKKIFDNVVRSPGWHWSWKWMVLLQERIECHPHQWSMTDV